MEEADKALYDFFDKFCYFISVNPDKYKRQDSSIEETFFASEKYILIREADDESVSFVIYNNKTNRVIDDSQVERILGVNPEKTLEESIYHFLDCSEPCEKYSVDKTKFKDALEFILG